MITEFRGDELSVKVLESMRKKLLLEYRFLEPGLYRLNIKSWHNDMVATDGLNYYHSVRQTLGRFVNGKEKDIELDYLHSVIHCIFLHPFIAYNSSDNDRIRDIAADICVANIMCDFGFIFEHEIMTWIEHFKDKHKVLTVGSLSKHLASSDESEQLLLEKLFKRDSHELWKRDRRQAENSEESKASEENEENTQANDEGEAEAEENPMGNNGGEGEDSSQDADYGDVLIHTLADEWKTASEKIKMDLENFSSAKYAGDMSLSFIQNIEAAVRERVNYRDFLMKFAKYEEKMKLDLDEFDYVYYSYGMNLIEKKRIALIEPLEYKDDQVIKDFVIAIDTSGSCSGDIIKNFLIKTYNILKDIEKLNEGFKKINFHIIQCDCRIQEDVIINSAEDFDQYMENFKVKGFGGTDFRPVFEHIDNLIHQKSLPKDFGGLIYFTDGYGAYPYSPPEYKTAMVFLDDDEVANNLKGVPVWAIKIIISEI